MSEKRTASALAPMEGDDAVDDGAESSLAGDASATKPTPTDLNVVLQVSGSPPPAQEMYTQTASDAAEDPNSPPLTPERSPSFNPVAKEDGIAVDKQKHPARTENMQLSDVVAVGAGFGSGAAGSSASGPSFVSRWSSAPARAGGWTASIPPLERCPVLPASSAEHVEEWTAAMSSGMRQTTPSIGASALRMVHAVPRWAPLEADMLPFTMRVTAPTGTLAAAPIGVPSNTVGRVQTIGINGVPVSIPPTPSTPADALVPHPELPPLTDFTTAAFAHLDKVERPTSEYVQVMQYLDSLVVESVYEVRNETLDMQYGIVISGSNIICSQKMLHGTSVASIDAIVREGFKVGGVEVTQKHGARNGRGIYMTAHAYTAANYSHRQKSQYIVLAETVVTPACFTLGGRPTGFGGRPLVAMDSVEGAANAAQWEYYKVVQPDKTLMRPLYVVKFKDETVQGQRQRFSGTKPAPSLDH